MSRCPYLVVSFSGSLSFPLQSIGWITSGKGQLVKCFLVLMHIHNKGSKQV